MNKALSLLVVVFVLAGCSTEHQYKSVEEFENFVASLKLFGKSSIESQVLMEKQGFNCLNVSPNEVVCRKSIMGFPCRQELIVKITKKNLISTEAIVIKAQNGKELPSVCL